MIYFGKALNAYKANLHTHSTVSDGKFSPQQVVDFYSMRGYDVLSFSDHRKTNDLTTLDHRGMTLLSGIELHPGHPRFGLWHLLAVNVPADFPGVFETAQEAVDAVNAAGGLIYGAHPYWCGTRSEEILSLHGLAGIEVYNSSTRYIGKEYNMPIWDELIDAGWNCPALAVDDIHSLSDFGHGWTMVLAEDKSPASIVDALKNGSFYATQGPEFTRIELDGYMLHAEFSEVVSAVVVGRFSSGCPVNIPGQPFPGDEKNCRELTVDLRRCRTAGRIQLRDAAGNYAWSNPIPVPPEK